MLETITLIAVVGLVVLFNHLLAHDIRYPAVQQALVWLGTLALYAVARENFLALHDAIMLLIGLGVISFTVGSFLAFKGLGGDAVIRHRVPQVRMQLLTSRQVGAVIILTLLAGGGAILYAQLATQYAATGPTRDLAFNLRYLSSVQGAPSPPLMRVTAYALPLLNTVVGFSLIYFRVTRDRRVLPPLLLAFMAALLMSVFSSGRGIVLFLLIEVGVIYAMTSARLRLRVILLALITFLGVFYLGASVLNNGADQSASFLQNLPRVLDALTSYLVGGMVALSVQLTFMRLDEGGANIFRTFYAVARALGYDVQVVSLVQPYTYIPNPINVYTMYLQYLKDFGFAGVIFFQLLFGALHTAFFMSYRRSGRPLPLFWLSVLSFPLLTQSFTDGYFSLLSTWIQYFILSFLLSQTLFKVQYGKVLAGTSHGVHTLGRERSSG